MVFEILFHRPEGAPDDYRNTDLYRACVEAGIIPGSPEGADSRAAVVPDASRTESGEELVFHVSGMWCTTCALLIESILRSTQGVVDAKVFFLSDLAHVQYLPQRTCPERILERVSRLGYTALPTADESQSARARKSLQLRLGIAAMLTANVMMISWALYLGFFQELGADGVQYLSWPLWLLSTPVIFYAGAPILRKAFQGILCGAVSMETLIAVGSLATYFFSVLQTISGRLHVYYDTASMLVTLVLLGKTIEAGARDDVSRGVTELLKAAGEKTRLLIAGRESWAASTDVCVGDEFLVLEGERVPMDGEMLEGKADVDEALLTGESKPVRKKPPDEVMNGSLLLNGKIRARVVRPNRESVLQQMIFLIREALAAKAPAEETADQVIRWIVPSVILLASATSLWVWRTGVSIEDALLRGLTVLVITCPCALGIAIPIAKVASISAGKLRGLIVRDPGALDRLQSLDAFVFDKTGTVTEGVFTLHRIFAPYDSEIEVLRRLGGVELCSDHLIAREVLRKCGQMGVKPEECTDFEAFEGMGVRGMVGGEEVFIGNRLFMANRLGDLTRDLDDQSLQCEIQGMSTTFFAWKGSVRGFLCLGDRMREGSRETISRLQGSGRKVFLVSGDSMETTRALSGALGVADFRGGMHPSEKAEFVGSLQREGLRVAVVGDGINDAPALARAEVAFTLGSGANLLREVSAITLLSGNIAAILDSLSLSRLHTQVARQNLVFAFAYNGLAIPIAMSGLLNPIIAVLAMFMSSLTVVANTLRIPRSVRKA
jgi:heavy metal translocating P-type ATPase